MSEVNTVLLVGRVTASGEPRTLPSGDTVRMLRVVVPRTASPGASRGHAGRPRRAVDTIDVACWTAGVRRIAEQLSIDDEVEVEGSLRRRFYRAGGAVGSRYEVEARRLRRVSSPGQGGGTT
ncbi:MAG: single-stranded DNA-binding protein [Dermatophilaceae bacterium]